MAWSALPKDLLESIAERLETRTQIMSVRAVCRMWRDSVPHSLTTSRKILSPILPYKRKDDDGDGDDPSILVASSVFLLQSAVNPELTPWLLTVEEFNPGKFFVRAPFSRVVSKELPVRPYNLDLSHIKVLELRSFYTLRRLDRPQEMFSEKRLTEYDNKVVLFVDPNCVTCPTIDDCTLVELYDQVDHLSVTRLKYGSKRHVYFRGREFDDIVNFKGRIYAVDFEGIAYAMDYHSLDMLKITTWNDELTRSNYKKRLVVSCGELYLVFRRCEISDNKGGAFKVFKLNKKKWEELKGIGDDKILFVTFDGCFVASVTDFPGWRGNCIVFRRGSFPEYSGIRSFDSKIFERWQVHLDVAVFHFENGDCKPLEVYPSYRAVIWPPPAWIWKR